MIIKEEDSFSYECPVRLDRMCLGDGCMAWRWHLIPNPKHKMNHPLDYIHKNPAEMESPWMRSATHGYCGMAGNP